MNENVILIKKRIKESIDLKNIILNDNVLLLALERVSLYCIDSLKSGGKIIFAGNGGSFADAQHLAAEFVSRFLFDREPIPSIALGTNSSLISSISNDYSFEQVFARELASLAGVNDTFIPISTSGNSQNILFATQLALDKGIQVIGWTGQPGGKLAEICDCLQVPSSDTPRIQECHIFLGHLLCEIVESNYLMK